MYTTSMQFVWDDTKRRANLTDHGLDFDAVPIVFEGLTFTPKDDRFDYSEIRFVSLGVLHGTAVGEYVDCSYGERT